MNPLRALAPRAGAIPFVPLGQFPTPVERVGGVLGERVELWVKRDDRSGSSGLYGGNKVRKLEFLLGDARARGAKRLVTLGGFGSHHVLATAIYGQAQGYGVDAIVFPQPITGHVKETVLAGAAAGCTFHAVNGYAAVVPLSLSLRARSGSHWIAPGGSSPTGTLGYVAAALELAEQVRAGRLPVPEVIYLALGSCGTVAGLLVGLAVAGLPVPLVAVRVVPSIVCNRRRTVALALQTARLLARHGVSVPPLPLDSLRVDHRFFGGAYGLATPQAEAAVERAARGGLHLETTYTGKAFAALCADADAGRLDGKAVLFLDTFSSADLGPLLAAAPPPSSLPPRLAALFGAAG